MFVKSITPSIYADDLVPADRFYGDFLRLDLIADEDNYASYGAHRHGSVDIVIWRRNSAAQVSVPVLSVAVSRVDRYYRRAVEMKLDVLEPLEDSVYGGMAFTVRDPFGTHVTVSGDT